MNVQPVHNVLAVDALINVMSYAVQICYVQSKMVKLFALVQVGSNSFPITLKMVVFVILMHVQPILIAIWEFVIMVNVQLLAATNMIVLMVNSVKETNVL